jgi:hypothetical protein
MDVYIYIICVCVCVCVYIIIHIIYYNTVWAIKEVQKRKDDGRSMKLCLKEDGTHFTFFTSTKVQILTPEELRRARKSQELG